MCTNEKDLPLKPLLSQVIKQSRTKNKKVCVYTLQSRTKDI